MQGGEQSSGSGLASMGLKTGERVAPLPSKQTWSSIVAARGVLEIPVLGNTV